MTGERNPYSYSEAELQGMSTGTLRALLADMVAVQVAFPSMIEAATAEIATLDRTAVLWAIRRINR